MDESELLDRLRVGDDEAWTRFVDSHSPRIWRCCARMIGADREAVADVVQDVFAAAAENLSQFRQQDGTLAGWLTGIAYRHAALWWRRQHRAPPESRDILSSANDGAPTAESRLEAVETAEGIRDVLASLPDDMAHVLIGFYLDDNSTGELARQMGITEDAVRSRLLRARDRFRQACRTMRREFV